MLQDLTPSSVIHYLSKRCQHVFQVVMVNETIAILINHVEGLLELLDLVLVEHGEHIAGGSLGPLLGGPSAGSLTRRHLGWNVLKISILNVSPFYFLCVRSWHYCFVGL